MCCTRKKREGRNFLPVYENPPRASAAKKNDHVMWKGTEQSWPSFPAVSWVMTIDCFPSLVIASRPKCFGTFPGIRRCNDRREFMALRDVVCAACNSSLPPREYHLPSRTCSLYRSLDLVGSVTGVSDRRVWGGLIGIYVGGVYTLSGYLADSRGRSWDALSKLLLRTIFRRETCHSSPRVDRELTWALE